MTFIVQSNNLLIGLGIQLLPEKPNYFTIKPKINLKTF